MPSLIPSVFLPLLSSTESQLGALKSELDLYKRLQHKNIVGYIDSQFDTLTSTLYIFLEYVPGGSISSMLERFGRFRCVQRGMSPQAFESAMLVTPAVDRAFRQTGM